MSLLKKAWFCVVIAALAGSVVVLEPDNGMAQEKRSLFDKLFGTRKKRKKSPTRKKTTARTKASPSQKAARTKPQIQKSDSAKRLLVIGDFIAASVAEGLIALYADNPDIVIIKQAEAASGLVRDDYYNWQTQLAKLMEAAPRPDMILVALGANDRQTLRLNGQAFDYGSEEWSKIYRQRVEKFTAQLGQGEPSLPWLWLGLPPFQKPQLSQFALALNGSYEEDVTKAGGHFVDIWRGFVDDKGVFNFSGHDINGQIARLRTSDGINFTAAGRVKLAFYANEIIQTLQQEKPQPEEIPLPDETIIPIKSSAVAGDVAAPVQEIKYIAPQKLWDRVEVETELVKSPTPVHALSSPLILQPGRADYFFAD